MSTYNSHTIIGRLGADPEVRFTASNTAVANLNVATSEKWKDRNGEMQESTTWHRVTLWGRKAEAAQEYLKKGSLVHITGPVEHRKWTDKEGVERTSVEIKALTMTMLGGGSGSANNASASNRSGFPNSSSGRPESTSSVHDAVDFDDLPF